MLRLQGQLDEHYTAASADELAAANRGRQAHPRNPGVHPGPPLPARRGHPLGRRPWRQLPPVGARPGARRGRVHRVLRRALHGRVGGRAHRRPPDRDPPRPQRRVLDGRHGRSRRGRGGVGRTVRGHRHRTGHPDHLHELLGRAEGVRRPKRRRRVHLHQRPGRARLGARQGPACGPGVGRRHGRRRQGAVLPGPAPRPQHRVGDGLRARRHAGVEPAARARRAHRGGVQGGHPSALEGPLLRAPALPARPRRSLPSGASRRHRRDAPRVPLRHLPDGRPRRLHRLHHPHGERGARRLRDRRRAPRSTSSTG